MLNFTHYKDYTTESYFFRFYELLDTTTSLFFKITFPLWIFPFLAIQLSLKVANLWKHIASLLKSLFNLHDSLPLPYAILKGNGQYLREQHPMVLYRQFYDYTSRKFMSIPELDLDSKIVQIQCDNAVGIKFFSQFLEPGNVTGLFSDRKLVKNISQPCKYLKQTNYSLQGQSMKVDCFLLFDLKNKMNYCTSSDLKLINILSYCSYHLSQQGYIVYGDYFEKGEIQTFQNLFKIYNLIVTDQEDISRNINYAKKLLAKDRKKFQLKMINFVGNLFSRYFQNDPLGEDKTFQVLILENKEADDHQ